MIPENITVSSRYSDWLWVGRSRDRIPGGGDIFHTCPDRTWGPPSLLYKGYWVFPGGKERPGRDADPSPPSSAVGHERVELYLYSPYGPHGLYRASVPVQGCTLPKYHSATCQRTGNFTNAAVRASNLAARKTYVMHIGRVCCRKVASTSADIYRRIFLK